MADILYVQSSYVAQGYVTQVLDAGSITITGATTTSSSAERIHPGTATINTTLGSDRSWDEMGTWYVPIQEVWDGFIIGEPIVGVGANVGTIANTTTITSSATKQANVSAVSISGAATFTVSATAQRPGDNTIPGSTVSVTSAATVTAKGTGSSATTTTVTGTAITGSIADAISIGISTTTSATGNRISPPESNITVGTSVTTSAGVTFNLTANIPINIATTVTSDSLSGLLIDPITITSPTVTTVNATIRNSGQASLASQYAVNADGVIIKLATATITGSTITLAEATNFAIDPFRTFKVLSESRINIIQRETRTKIIDSETRTLQVQHLTLVDDAGLIDRRSG